MSRSSCGPAARSPCHVLRRRLLQRGHLWPHLLNLSFCHENKDPIATAGAILPLVHALKTGTPTAPKNAAVALLCLSEIEEHKIAIGHSSMIPHLVQLLEIDRPRGKDTLTMLYLLCSTRANKIRALKGGIVRSLLEPMADPKSGMVDKAACVLYSLVAMVEGRSAVMEDGGISVLEDGGSPRTNGAKALPPVLARSSASALTWLASLPSRSTSLRSSPVRSTIATPSPPSLAPS